MKALILAAGLGSRLKELTATTNKCCLQVGEQSVLSRLLTIFSAHDVADVHIVTGYCADKVQQEAGDRAQYIYNPLFHAAGILVSVWTAKHALCGQPFLLTTGDNFFHQKIFAPFLATSGDIVVAVKKKVCAPEDVKVVVADHKIVQFEEHIPAEGAAGEFGMLIYFKTPEISRVFFDTVEQFLGSGKQKVRLIDSLNHLIAQGYTITPYFFAEHLGVEIDTAEDLAKAQLLEKSFRE